MITLLYSSNGMEKWLCRFGMTPEMILAKHTFKKSERIFIIFRALIVQVLISSINSINKLK